MTGWLTTGNQYKLTFSNNSYSNQLYPLLLIDMVIERIYPYNSKLFILLRNDMFNPYSLSVNAYTLKTISPSFFLTYENHWWLFKQGTTSNLCKALLPFLNVIMSHLHKESKCRPLSWSRFETANPPFIVTSLFQCFKAITKDHKCKTCKSRSLK